MIFANIDGPNGVGKTSVINAVTDLLREKSNISTYAIHFHRRNTSIGTLIQQILNGDIKMSSETLQMLYSADRLDFTKNEYKRLKENDQLKILISDRYITSGIVYGMSDGLSFDTLRKYDEHCSKPDINIILTAPVDVLIERLKNQKLNTNETGDIFETYESLTKVLNGYETIQQYVSNVVYVDANRPLDEVVAEVFFILKTFRKGFIK